MKPTLNLYLDWECTGIISDDEGPEWQWAILLRPRTGDRERQVLILNKNRQETFPPLEIIGARFASISMSMRDTTMHFIAKNFHKTSVGFMPTQYAIEDPVHGGEVYPQWPEELEEAGISSHPDEPVSAPPSADWDRQREALVQEQDERHTREANEFLEDERNAD